MKSNNVIDLRPDLNSIEADRMLIKQAAGYINNLWQQNNAAETYIAAGREFSNLKDHLFKNSRKHDTTRIGWQKAFDPKENLFACDRRQAERYIVIYEAFFHTGNVLPVWKLPQSFRALFALAKLKLSSERLRQLSDGGAIKHDSTESEVKKIVQQKHSPKKKQLLPKATAPKQQRIAAALRILKRLDLTIADLKGNH